MAIIRRRHGRLLVIPNGPLSPVVAAFIDEWAEDAVEEFLTQHPELRSDEAGNAAEMRETPVRWLPRLRRVK